GACDERQNDGRFTSGTLDACRSGPSLDHAVRACIGASRRRQVGAQTATADGNALNSPLVTGTPFSKSCLKCKPLLRYFRRFMSFPAANEPQDHPNFT